MIHYKSLPILFVFIMLIIACQGTYSSKENNTSQEAYFLDSTLFSGQIDGEDATLYTLKNKQGMIVALTNFGARIVSIIVKDKKGINTDVVLGFNKVEDYNNEEEPYFGSVIGPFGNRISKGKMLIDNKEYNLSINNDPHTLHGGVEGLHFQVWKTKFFNQDSVVFSCELPDGKEGFPGNRKFQVKYSLNENNELEIGYKAISDIKTVFNLTNHAYFNLNGEGSGTILDHHLTIFADYFTPVDESLIPIGEIQDVKDTPFDFRKSKRIGRDIEITNSQLEFGKGYDHNFVLNGTRLGAFNYACRLVGNKSGIIMDVLTEEPGLQFYSGNFMSDKVILKNGSSDSYRTGLCLETQHFPDSPNHPSFPNTVYKPNQTYTTKSVYKFSTE